jgi:hypothetical protein
MSTIQHDVREQVIIDESHHPAGERPILLSAVAWSAVLLCSPLLTDSGACTVSHRNDQQSWVVLIMISGCSSSASIPAPGLCMSWKMAASLQLACCVEIKWQDV